MKENSNNKHIHYHNQVDESSQKKSGLDTFERISKIISIIAIPLIIAIYGNLIKQKLSNQSLEKDYVNLAVEILTKNEDEVDQPIREWAVDLLNDNAPTKMSEKAISTLKNGDSKLPNLKIADEEFNSKNFDKAAEYYTSLINANPNDPELFSKRGYSYYQKRQFNKAIKDFNKAIQLEPNEYAYYFFKSLVYSKIGDYELSNDMLTKTIELAPNHKSAINNKGINYVKLGLPKLACEEFRKAITLGEHQAKENFNKYCK